MLKLAMFLLFNFLCLVTNAQFGNIYLSVEQEIYFPEEVVRGAVSFASSSKDNVTVAAQLINSEGEVIENYFILLQPNTTKQMEFLLPPKLQSGWYFIKVELPGYFIDVRRILVLDINLGLINLGFLNRYGLSYFTEGDNKLVYNLPNNFYVRFNLDVKQKLPEQVEIKNGSGEVLLSAVVEENGFAKLIFTPDSLMDYFVEATYPDQLVVSKKISKNLFSEKSIAMSTTFINEKAILVGLNSKQTLLGVKLGVFYNSKMLNTQELIGNKLELRVDISEFPYGLLRLVLFNENGNILNERIVFNKKSEPQIKKSPIIKSRIKAKRGERINVEIDFNEAEIFNKQIIVKVVDKKYSLSSNIKIENDDALKLGRLKYLFPELAENTSNLSSKQLDIYFAVNRLITQPHIDKLKTLLKNDNFFIKGRLLSAQNKALAFVPLVIAIPAIGENIRYVNTDENGRFSFKELSFSGKQKIYLVPLLLDKSQKYSIELESKLEELETNGAASFYSPKDWNAMLNSLLIKYNINKAFKDQTSSFEPILIDESNGQVKSVLNEVDYDLNLDEYEVFENMDMFINQVVPGLNVRKGKLSVFSNQLKKQLPSPPMVLLDGVPYFDIERLLKIDPIRFSRIQVVSDLKKLQKLGVIGTNGTVAFYTGKGYEIENNNSQFMYINGYRDEEWGKELNLPKSFDRIPYIPSSFMFSTQKNPDFSGKLNFNFLAPDISTNICISVELVGEENVIITSKNIKIE